MNFYRHRGKTYGVQTDDISCGPIAIFNGYSTLSEEKRSDMIIRQLGRLCRTNREHENGYVGTCPSDFEVALNRLGFNVQRISVRKLREYLDRNENCAGAWILFGRGCDKDFGAHYIYVRKGECGRYVVVNGDHNLRHYDRYEDFESYFTQHSTDRWELYRYPIIWAHLY